jgi:hypothetical protein
MAILSGRYGQVLYDVAGTTPVVVVSLNHWTASFKTAREDVSCFGDTNKVYVPGLKDITGTLEGFWNSTELALFDGADAPAPGLLQLVPNMNEALFYWKGKAYLDADIDCTLSAPKVKGTFAAAGPWTGPTQTVPAA